MAPREIRSSANGTSYPAWCLPEDHDDTRGGDNNDVIAVEDGVVEFERQRMQLFGVDANWARLLAIYPVNRRWRGADVERIVRRAVFNYAQYAQSSDVDAITATLVELVKLAKWHEWSIEDHGNNSGYSWRVDRNFGKKTFGDKKRNRPFKPKNHFHLLVEQYRKCYDVCEHSIKFCCINECSSKFVLRRNVTKNANNDDLISSSILLDEKCKFCFAREHSVNCQASLACRCYCMVYQHDMMWSPIGEGTFEFRDPSNRSASFVDPSNGELLLDVETIGRLVTMGFATVKTPQRCSSAANTRTVVAERILKNFAATDDDGSSSRSGGEDNDDCDMADDEDDDDIAAVATTASKPAAVTGVDRTSDNIAVPTKYRGVTIRCCACLFTVTLNKLSSWKQLNFRHGAHCPCCAFVRHPFTNNTTVLSFLELSYIRQFSKLHALTYAPCPDCECRHINQSSFE